MPGFPRFIPPCLPTLRTAPPRGPGWLHEIKFDGYRVQLHKAGRRVLLLSRHGHDMTRRFPAICAAVRELQADAAILDGELCASDIHGQPDFRALHLRADTAPIAVWRFDALALDGRDLRGIRLDERRQLLHVQAEALAADGKWKAAKDARLTRAPLTP